MKKYLAEMIGTMVLVLLGCGSAIFNGGCGTTAQVLTVASAFGLSVVAIFFTLPNLFPSIVVLVLALLLWVMTLFVWRKVLGALCSRRLLFTIPYFIMTQPIYNLIYRLRSRRFRERNYTWH